MAYLSPQAFHNKALKRLSKILHKTWNTNLYTYSKDTDHKIYLIFNVLTLLHVNLLLHLLPHLNSVGHWPHLLLFIDVFSRWCHLNVFKFIVTLLSIAVLLNAPAKFFNSKEYILNYCTLHGLNAENIWV